MNRGINKKGYFTLEAAIFLPIFIIGVLTLGYFVKAFETVGSTVHVSCDEARYLASRAYSVRSNPVFKVPLKRRILSDVTDVTRLRIQDFKYLSGSDSGEISFSVKYRMRIPLPLDFQKEIQAEEQILCRGWIGRTIVSEGMGFAAMEGNGGGLVWIFPQSGTHYHTEKCTYVANEPTQLFLNQQIKASYEPCHSCHPEDMKNGSLVYCYRKYGEAYHRGNCNKVEKYSISISKEEAESRGYVPCSKCGGAINE